MKNSATGMSASGSNLLSDFLHVRAGDGQIARQVVLALAGTLLIGLCAKIQVPMWPVPMTMQTFAVLLVGLAFGARLGSATIALYLIEGALGLPVFAAGGGVQHLFGPTGGYLVGFLPAVAIVGLLAERGWSRPVLSVFAAMILGSAVIYLCGVSWLASLVGLEKAISFGLVPFLLGDAVKAALAAALLPMAWTLLSRAR